MAERPNPRSIAVIRRITGARDGNLPRLAIFRRSHRQGGARLLAAIATRTGLAGRVARHSLGFGQSLWPLHPRRYMAGAGMRMVLRRRRRRPPPPTPQIRYTWPRSRQSTIDAFDGHGADAPLYLEPSIDDASPPMFAERDAEGEAIDQSAQIYDEYEEAQTPAEAMLSRHEAFLGLPLRSRRPATAGHLAPPRVVQARAALAMPYVARTAGGDQFAPFEGVAETTSVAAIGTEPATGPITVRRVASGGLDGVQEVRPLPSRAATSLVAARQMERSESPGSAGQVLPRTGGLHAFRQIASFQPLPSSASAIGLTTSVASRTFVLGGELTDRPSPVARFAPVALALNRTSIMTRTTAQRASASFAQPATSRLVWPAATPDRADLAVGVPPMPGTPAGAAVFDAPPEVAGLGVNQFVDGSNRDWAIAPVSYGVAAQPVGTRLSPGHDDPDDARPMAYRVAVAGDKPFGRWSVATDAIESTGPEPITSGARSAFEADRPAPFRTDARRQASGFPSGWIPSLSLQVAATTLSRSWATGIGDPVLEQLLSGEDGRPAWSSRRRSGPRGLAFPTGVNRMQATATDLVLRRAPGVAMRSFLGADAVRIMNWPVVPVSAETQSFQVGSPTSSYGRAAEIGVLEPPIVGGPLPAPTGRVRRAMRVEPIRATLTPQYPTGALAAPHPGAAGASWPTQGATTPAARVVAMPTAEGGGDDTGPVPPELVPAFAARRAEHVTWGETLAVGGPPPLLAVEPSGASAVNVAQPIAGVLHRLAFTDAWHRPADGSPQAMRERAAAVGATLSLPLGGTGLGSPVRARSASRQAVAGAAPGATWPNAFGSAAIAAPVDGVRGSLASTSSSGRWDPADLSLAAIGRSSRDVFAGGGWLAMSGRPAGAARSVLGAVSDGSVADVPPVFAGGWPVAASEQMVLQRRTRTTDRGRPAGRIGADVLREGSGAAWGQAGGIAPVVSAEAAIAPQRWATTPSLPIARPWRRSLTSPPPMTTAEQAFARWPVFRSAIADLAEPGAAQRSVAAEAMAASEGQALSPLVRRSMEHLFRMDLAPVRVHSGAQAARATGAVAARAMAHGTDIYLPGGVGDGPGGADMPLLAHELTHVAHHMGHRPPAAMPSLTLARRSAPEEHDAERIERMVADAVAVQDQSTVQREPAALTLARRPAPVTIMRVETDAMPSASATASGPGSAPATAGGAATEQDKSEENKQTDKLAEELFRRLERRLIVARERGGHRW